jgi:hypothetical protein
MPLGRSRKPGGTEIKWVTLAAGLADDVNVVGENIDTLKKNTGTLIDASKEVSLEVNTDKSKYMLLSRHQNARQNHDIKTANRCFENVAYSLDIWE